MADFEGTTSSRPAAIRPGMLEKLENYLMGFDLFGCRADVHELKLQIHGQDFLDAAPFGPDGDPDTSRADPEAFLRGLAPFLEPESPELGTAAPVLVVQSIGHEQTRFPLAAWQWTVLADGRIETNGF